MIGGGGGGRQEREGASRTYRIEARQPLLKLGQNETQIEYISGRLHFSQAGK